MKKKGKIIVTITIGLAMLALSTVMFMQFKLVNETDITSIENMREEELRQELANWKEKYNEANEQLTEKSKTLEEYREQEATDAESEALVEEELERVNLLLGKTDVEGEGVTITLKDVVNEEGDYLIITSDMLNKLVNELKLAGAEAISINEQRIINISDIVTINESLIFINQQRIFAPYVVKVIGDSNYLESSLIGKDGEIYNLQRQGYDISIDKSNRIQIPKYEQEINSKYIEEE